MQYPTKSEYVKASQDASDNLDMSTKATDEELNEAIIDEYGVKYSKDGRKLLKSPRELNGTYSIKRGTKIICDEAFRWRKITGCRFLTDIVIPDSVTSIGDYAFAFCRSLTNIVIPDNVTSIEEKAFCRCSSLNSIVIPDSVTSIGNSAFEGCYSLTSIVIPVSVTYIGHHAFANCNLSNTLRQELSSRFGDKIFW